MDKTLASNFCPFRSPSWPVSNKERSVAFSFEPWRHVWRYVVGHVERPVVICNGKHAFRYFGGVVERQGGRRIGGESDFIGWGDQTYEVARYGTAVLAAVPHLSRYRIFGRPNPGTWSITSSRPSPRRSMSN